MFKSLLVVFFLLGSISYASVQRWTCSVPAAKLQPVNVRAYTPAEARVLGIQGQKGDVLQPENPREYLTCTSSNCTDSITCKSFPPDANCSWIWQYYNKVDFVRYEFTNTADEATVLAGRAFSDSGLFCRTEASCHISCR